MSRRKIANERTKETERANSPHAPNQEHRKNSPTIPPPPATTRRLVRLILGFSVSVAVGLAPYLGRIRVPLFAPLLDLIPLSVQDTAIPLAAALMGVVAVVIQWYGWERSTAEWLNRAFIAVVMLVLAGFVSLFVVHTLVVARVPYGTQGEAAFFLVGFSRPVRAPCTAELSDADCIKLLTFNTSRIESFWGDRSIRIAKLALVSAYLLFMSAFGFLVGVLMLQQMNPRAKE